MKNVKSTIGGICILFLLSGCLTIKQSSFHEAANKQYNKGDYLIINDMDKQFLLYNFNFHDNYLEGDLTFTFTKKMEGTFIYAHIDDSIVSRGDFPKHTIIKNENISGITINKTNTLKTVACIIAVPAAAWCIYWGIRIGLIFLAYL
jgi:hypothetical protein